MHILAYFTRTLFHSDDGGTQLLSRNIPIDNLLRFSPRRRTRYSEIVRKKSNKNGKEHTR